METDHKNNETINLLQNLKTVTASEALKNKIVASSQEVFPGTNLARLFAVRYALFSLMLLFLSGTSFIASTVDINGSTIAEKIVNKVTLPTNKNPKEEDLLIQEAEVKLKAEIESEDTEDHNKPTPVPTAQIETSKKPSAEASVDNVKLETPIENLNLNLPLNITIGGDGGSGSPDNLSSPTPTEAPLIKTEIDLPLLNETQINLSPDIKIGL